MLLLGLKKIEWFKIHKNNIIMNNNYSQLCNVHNKIMWFLYYEYLKKLNPSILITNSNLVCHGDK
jgi:hypothetical protein